MAVGMIMAVLVEVLMLMGMVMGMLVGMDMLVGVGNTVVGVLVGVGMFVVVAVATHMIVMDMHKNRSFRFPKYSIGRDESQNIYL